MPAWLLNQSLAAKWLLRLYQKTSPWNWLPPLGVENAVSVAPPEAAAVGLEAKQAAVSPRAGADGLHGSQVDAHRGKLARNRRRGSQMVFALHQESGLLGPQRQPGRARRFLQGRAVLGHEV